MRNALILARKDLAAFFHSWTGVLVFVFFYLVAGVFFSLLVLSYSKLSLEAARNASAGVHGLGLTRFVFSSLFLNLGIVLIFVVPLISMRSFAEERKLQTLELLFTYPFTDFDIVGGKFLGLLGFFFFFTPPLIGYLWLVYGLGGTLDWGPVLMGYAGFWLLGSAYLSLGLFVSSLTESQVASAIVTFSIFVIFWMLDWMATLTDGAWSLFLSALSPLGHYREFTLGVFDLSNFSYFVFFTLYFLFLTLRSIEGRNWKG